MTVSHPFSFHFQLYTEFYRTQTYSESSCIIEKLFTKPHIHLYLFNQCARFSFIFQFSFLYILFIFFSVIFFGSALAFNLRRSNFSAFNILFFRRFYFNFYFILALKKAKRKEFIFFHLVLTGS